MCTHKNRNNNTLHSNTKKKIESFLNVNKPTNLSVQSIATSSMASARQQIEVIAPVQAVTVPVPCTPTTAAPATVAHTGEALVPATLIAATLSVVKKRYHKCVQDIS